MDDDIIYLDNNASTPIDPRVLDAMIPVLREVYANPSSTTHIPGRRAAALVEEARGQVAALINAEPHELIFTSGATESNNLAILGFADAAPPGAKALTCAIEHKSVLGPVEELQRRGIPAVILGVDRRGRLDMDQLEFELKTGRTFLVSIQAANSEIGTRQDIPAIVELAHQHGAAVHCDATQAVGKVPVDVLEWGVDFLSFNAHKLYGPKGVGALFAATGPRNWPLKPLMFGGSQEYGLRPGTLDTPNTVGFGAAASFAPATNLERLALMRDELEDFLRAAVVCEVNGDPHFRLPSVTSLTFHGVDAEALLANSKRVALSMASACQGAGLEPSYVVSAIGLSSDEALSTVRFSLGQDLSVEQLHTALSLIERSVRLIGEPHGGPAALCG